VLGLADLFGIAAGYGHPSAPVLSVTHWRQHAPEAAPVRDDGGAAGTLHALIVPPTLAEPPGPAESTVLAAWLRARHAEGAALASVCVGAFVLADTGLMAGRRLTTPQTYAAALRQRHPDVRVDADQPLVDEGDVITAGGLMHWPALGLRLVERFLGPDAMLHTARALLIDPPDGWRPGPGVFAPRLAHGDLAVLKAQHWLQATQARDVALASLARSRPGRAHIPAPVPEGDGHDKHRVLPAVARGACARAAAVGAAVDRPGRVGSGLCGSGRVPQGVCAHRRRGAGRIPAPLRSGAGRARGLMPCRRCHR